MLSYVQAGQAPPNAKAANNTLPHLVKIGRFFRIRRSHHIDAPPRPSLQKENLQIPTSRTRQPP